MKINTRFLKLLISLTSITIIFFVVCLFVLGADKVVQVNVANKEKIEIFSRNNYSLKIESLDLKSIDLLLIYYLPEGEEEVTYTDLSQYELDNRKGVSYIPLNDGFLFVSGEGQIKFKNKASLGIQWKGEANITLVEYKRPWFLSP